MIARRWCNTLRGSRCLLNRLQHQFSAHQVNFQPSASTPTYHHHEATLDQLYSSRALGFRTQLALDGLGLVLCCAPRGEVERDTHGRTHHHATPETHRCSPRSNKTQQFVLPSKTSCPLLQLGAEKITTMMLCAKTEVKCMELRTFPMTVTHKSSKLLHLGRSRTGDGRRSCRAGAENAATL